MNHKANTIHKDGKIADKAHAKPSASQMLRIMQALSAEAQKAGVAEMTLDEINAEIEAARKFCL